MIKQDKITEIRDRASIVEVISDYVTLKKAGRNYQGLCPFHGEKTPSFTVSEEKGIFHCFGCQAGGSVFHFLMKYDQLSFPEAVERVAKRYGIKIEPSDGAREPGESGELSPDPFESAGRTKSAGLSEISKSERGNGPAIFDRLCASDRVGFTRFAASRKTLGKGCNTIGVNRAKERTRVP